MSDYYSYAAGTFQKGTKARAETVESELQALNTGLALLPSQNENNRGTRNYATDTGTANAYACALSHVSGSYADGQDVYLKVANTNTGASTLNVSAVGAVAIRHTNGDALEAGDLPADGIAHLKYNGTYWILMTRRFDGVAGGDLTGVLNERQGTNIASAATTDIGGADGNLIVVTGTTTITALGTAQAGARRIVKFSGATKLTYNATSLILPWLKDIRCQDGDYAEFISLGSGNWKCLSYQFADGSGSFTPTLWDNDEADYGQTASVAAGYYTRLGDRVFFDLRLTMSSLGTLNAAHGAKIGNLPYRPFNQSNGFIACSVGLVTGANITAGQSVCAYVAPDGYLIYLYLFDAATGATAMTVGEFSASGSIIISGNFQIRNP